ncbi:MAG TPA: hypothetical protein VF517_04930 [Thermoleophilaceae bacterium]
MLADLLLRLLTSARRAENKVGFFLRRPSACSSASSTPGGTLRDLNRKDLAMLKRMMVPAALGDALGTEPGFWDHARHVQLDPAYRRFADLYSRCSGRWQREEPDTSDLALHIAGYYGNGPTRRRIIALYLREGARSLDEGASSTLAEIRLLQLGSDAYFPESPLSEDDQWRRPTAQYRDLIAAGSQAIAWRGAGKCIACGAGLPERTQPGTGAVVSRHARRNHCDNPEHCRRELRDVERWQTHAVDVVFDRCAYMLRSDPLEEAA